MTQSDINNKVNYIVNTYTGQRAAYYDTDFGQASVPVCYYVDLITGEGRAPGMTNDRADGWGVDFPATLSPYFTHEAFLPNRVYPKGTILIWNTPHIAIVLSHDGANNVEVFEQNADPEGSPCHVATRSLVSTNAGCTYALIPIVVFEAVPAPTPTETPSPKHTVPAAPLPYPSSTKKITLDKTNGYNSYTDALKRINPVMEINQGNYYIFKTLPTNLNIICISKTPGKAYAWINTAPLLTPTANTSDNRYNYQPFRDQSGNRINVKYVAVSSYMVKDLSGARGSLPLKAGVEIPMAGTFLKNGTEYWRPAVATKKFLWYGVPFYDPETGEPILRLETEVYDTSTTTSDRLALKTAKLQDKIALAISQYGKVFDVITRRKLNK